jgi:hypothetical protein
MYVLCCYSRFDWSLVYLGRVGHAKRIVRLFSKSREQVRSETESLASNIIRQVGPPPDQISLPSRDRDQQGQVVWEKRVAFADLKCNFPVSNLGTESPRGPVRGTSHKYYDSTVEQRYATDANSIYPNTRLNMDCLKLIWAVSLWPMEGPRYLRLHLADCGGEQEESTVNNWQWIYVLRGRERK